MVGNLSSVSGSSRRPMPFPPGHVRSTQGEAPPPYTKSTMTSAAPPSAKKNQKWWSGCELQQLWVAFVKKIQSLYKSFTSLFQKKKPAIKTKEEVVEPSRTVETKEEVVEATLTVETKEEVVEATLTVGELHSFDLPGYEHLAYLVTLNTENDLELLGLRFVVRGQEKKVEFKQFDQLDEAERAIALVERRQIEQASAHASAHASAEEIPFKIMLNTLLKWVCDKRFEGNLVRKIDKWDVNFIADYITLNFRVENNPSDLKAFEDDLKALKKRLQSIFNKIRCITPQTQEDFLRFRHMLAFIGVDGFQVDDKDLHRHWNFWDEYDFNPEDQIAILLDQEKDLDPALYQGMSVVFSSGKSQILTT